MARILSLLRNVKLFTNPHLAYCDISGTLVFLDIARDRYFCLSAPANIEALAYLDHHNMPRNH